MECDRWQELLLDRLADDLSEDDAIRLEQHLVACPRCTAEENCLRRLWQAAADAGTHTESWDHLYPALRSAVAEGRHEGHRQRQGRTLSGRLTTWRGLIAGRIPAAAAAVLVLGALATGYGLGRGPARRGTDGPATERRTAEPVDPVPTGSPAGRSQDTRETWVRFAIAPADALPPLAGSWSDTL